MHPRRGTALAALALCAALGCSDSHSSTRSKDKQPAPENEGTGGRTSAATTGTGGTTSGTGGRTSVATGTGGTTSGTGGSPVPPADNSTCCTTLECVCASPAKCESYTERLQAALDCKTTLEHDPRFSPIRHGCGLVDISIGNGVTGTTRVYRQSDHELVGGGTYSDDGSGCETENTDLTKCPDFSMCDPCPGGLFHYPLCPESPSADADAGM